MFNLVVTLPVYHSCQTLYEGKVCWYSTGITWTAEPCPIYGLGAW